MDLLKRHIRGFTLVEIIVVVALIGLLASAAYVSYGEVRTEARDRKRMADLRQLQLAIENYKQVHGRYPLGGCGYLPSGGWVGPGPSNTSWHRTCAEYISGLVPDFISALPTDPNRENESDRGFMYKTDASGTQYKVLVYQTVERLFVDNFDHEFSRCSRIYNPSDGCTTQSAIRSTYAIYSHGSDAPSW